MAELKWEPSVHAEQIGVQAKGGVVTLTGHVSSYQEKSHAEWTAQRVEGVKALAIEMDVRLSALEWMGTPVSTQVNLRAEKGWTPCQPMWTGSTSAKLGAVKHEIEAALARRSKAA